MKQPQQPAFNASRGRFNRRPLPLASLSGAALLLSLGLLQNAAAEPIRADAALVPQINSGEVTGEITIVDPLGIASGAAFLAPVANNSTVNVSGNGASSNAIGNKSLPEPGAAFNQEINNQPEIALARVVVDQVNLGLVTSQTQGQALIRSESLGASSATATVTKNKFDANTTANQAITSIGIQTTGALTLSEDGVQLISGQSNESPDIGASTDAAIGVVLGGISTANTGTVTGNTAASQAINNQAGNSITITGAASIDTTGTTGTALTLENMQTVASPPDMEMGMLPSNLTASTVNTLGVFAEPGANISNGSFTINDNQTSASAQRNLASNVLGVAEGSIFTGALPLFSLINDQLDDTIGATVSADTAANTVIKMDSTGTGFNLQATISGNQTSAAAGVNTASNEVFLGTAGAGVRGLAGVSGALENIQAGQSTVAATAKGYASMNAADMLGVGILTGTLTVSNNATQSSASGNQADNTFGAVADGANALDVSVTSFQTYGGEIPSSVTSTARGSAGVTANVPIATTVTVSGNTLTSQAMVNTARNRSSLDSTTTVSNSTLAVDNQQLSNASATSMTELEGFGVVSPGQLISENVSVSGNLASAKATQNVATNALAIKASAISGAATPAPALVTDQAVTADYGVYNQQDSSQSTTAIVQAQPIPGFGANSGVGIFVAGTLPTNMSVTNNVLSAVARANVADNQLQASSTTTLNGASFGLANNQLSLGDTTASITQANLGVQNLFGSGTLAPRVSVSGNQLEAAASGNAAFNALSVNAGTSLTADASAPLNTSMSASAGYAVLNNQVNAGAITAQIEAPVIGLQAFNATPGQLTSITGNTVSATAYGNHAVNSVALSALPGQLSTSAALVSSQINSGNVSASVSNTFIGSNVTGANGSTTVAHNQVSASAVGNMALSSMVIGSK